MAAQTFLNRVSGRIKQIASIITSAGAGDSGKLVSLDATGRFDLSVMPTGIGPETVVIPSSENLAAGDLVNIWTNIGAANARKADASAASSGKIAHGFVVSAVTSPADATVYLPSQQNNQVSGLSPGAVYYLSATPGGVTTTPPSTTGHTVQIVGVANIAGNLLFNPEVAPTELA